MRNHGPRFELVPMQPHDHIGWVYSGMDEFARLVRPFLQEGASKGEALMLVAEDPDAAELGELVAAFDPMLLQVSSIAEVYGPSGIADAGEQRATFMAASRTAVAEGYTGIRVAADNSPLVGTPERFDSWIRWELTADRFMSEHSVTGLCAFDRNRVTVDALRHLSTLHPLSSRTEPVPQFLLFADDDGVQIEGEVDSFAVDHLWMALDVLPPKTKVTVDMTRANLRGDRVRASLEALAATGVDVTFLGLADAVGPTPPSGGLASAPARTPLRV